MGKGTITWTAEVEKALEKLKENLGRLPTLASPKVEEPLVVYLSTSKETISVVLVSGRKEVGTFLLHKLGSTRSKNELVYYRKTHVDIIVYNEEDEKIFQTRPHNCPNKSAPQKDSDAA